MRNFSRILSPALAAVLHNPLPLHRAVFQRALTFVRSRVYWSLVVQYRTHTTETLHYLADYLYDLHVTKDDYTPYRTSKATDSIAHAHMKDLKMQLKAEHAIEDEESSERGEALSRAQKEHPKADHTERQKEVYNSTVHEHTRLDFVKFHLMAHYDKSVQLF